MKKKKNIKTVASSSPHGGKILLSKKSPVELEELKESNKFSLLPTSPPLNSGYELLWL